MKKMFIWGGSLLLSGLLTGLFSTALYAAEVQGKIRLAEPVTLSTNLAAEVVMAAASPGQRVKKGELLIKLDDSVLRALQEQQRAELAHQKLLLDEAKHELQRSEELYDRTLLSDHDLVMARVGHAEANSSYQRASAELKAAQRAVELSRIVAPFDATVVERHVQSGETINGRFSSARLYTLVAADRYLVRVTLDLTQLHQINVGDELSLQVGKQQHSGRVEMIKGLGSSSVTVDILLMLEKGEDITVGEAATLTLR